MGPTHRAPTVCDDRNLSQTFLSTRHALNKCLSAASAMVYAHGLLPISPAYANLPRSLSIQQPPGR